ncbi:YdcF family protein [Mariprofundus ferrooxydans]|uniref:Probable transmembrane protein n=1 Tax=Mariprofundus ferrooxydans PV-1 TaxID=314345 RepID=Q0F241_9PROT|nr:YdcF family protein [Mariprofundus ferrooxydans]EAU55709.1 probable transmembrane protein [Mariprofundus ferrooxydans PV-1]KON47872.1 hypothetical protein AL013_05155 [Mariprofundus ferrooxydans]
MNLLLSKMITELLLPPGGLIVLAATGLVFWKRSWGRAIVILALALLWLLSTAPVRDLLLNPLEQRYPALDISQLQQMKADDSAIVVLGGGLYPRAPEYGGQDSLHDDGLMRTLYAADLALKSNLDVYATGGAFKPGQAEPEGLIMARMLIRFGVDPEHIHSENRARTTWENGLYIRDMMKKAGIHRIILVTTAWHMPRSVRVFESLGMHVIAAPCSYRAGRQAYDLRSYLPRWNVLSDSGDGLHEYLGLLWYRLAYQ